MTTRSDFYRQHCSVLVFKVDLCTRLPRVVWLLSKLSVESARPEIRALLCCCSRAQRSMTKASSLLFWCYYDYIYLIIINLHLYNKISFD